MSHGNICGNHGERDHSGIDDADIEAVQLMPAATATPAPTAQCSSATTVAAAAASPTTTATWFVGGCHKGSLTGGHFSGLDGLNLGGNLGTAAAAPTGTSTHP